MLLPLRRTLLLIAVTAMVPLLAACPKKETPSVEPPPAPEPTPEPETTVLVPVVEDEAEEDAGADAAPVKNAGKAVNPNVARLRQCCNALTAEAKRMGASPEAGMIMSAATQCNGMAAQAAGTGSAPELGVLTGLLSGRTLPPICSGF